MHLFTQLPKQFGNVIIYFSRLPCRFLSLSTKRRNSVTSSESTKKWQSLLSRTKSILNFVNCMSFSNAIQSFFTCRVLKRETDKTTTAVSTYIPFQLHFWNIFISASYWLHGLKSSWSLQECVITFPPFCQMESSKWCRLITHVERMYL